MSSAPDEDDTKTLEMANAYRRDADAWGLLEDDASAANPIFDRLQALQKILRHSAAGRAAIRDVADSPSPRVRLIGASHMLPFDPETAIPILEELTSTRGLQAVSAKYTLKSFREGKLNLDW